MSKLFIKAVIFTLLIVVPLTLLNSLSRFEIITLETKNLILICAGIILGVSILIATRLRRKKKTTVVDESDEAE